ncbi:15098_t:CDS:2 [Funneliformis geosporum]|nr:15098_t:CDS:2 [Funneliformis geosporum]
MSKTPSLNDDEAVDGDGAAVDFPIRGIGHLPTSTPDFDR